MCQEGIDIIHELLDDKESKEETESLRDNIEVIVMGLFYEVTEGWYLEEVIIDEHEEHVKSIVKSVDDQIFRIDEDWTPQYHSDDEEALLIGKPNHYHYYI